MSNFENILKGLTENEITFKTSLLSDKTKEVTFSPMTVKDQKVLLINTDSESYINQLKSLVQLLKNCIKSTPTKVEEMFVQDFIWLILNLRMKSIGESVEVSSVCKECKKRNLNIKIDFSKNIITTYLETVKDNIIAINPELKLVLNFPRIKHVLSKKNDSTSLDILADEIDYVEFKNEVVELHESEKIKLLETLDVTFLKNFEQFESSNVFGVSLKFAFKCEHCQADNEVEIKENVLDFF